MLARRWCLASSTPVLRRRQPSWHRCSLPPRTAPLASRPLHAGAALHGRRRTRKSHQTISKPDSGDGDLVVRLQSALPNVDVALETDGLCPGCGIALQTHAPSGWGYVPASQVEEAAHSDDLGAKTTHSLLCQRCHRLRHHNDTSVRQMTALQAQRQLEAALGQRRCIVVVVVDLLDFHGSFIPGLAKNIGRRRPVVIVANKVDLLPSSAHKVRLEQWVWRESRKLYAYPENIKSVHLVSSAMQQGVPTLLASIRSQALSYSGRDGTPAEVVGCQCWPACRACGPFLLQSPCDATR